MLINFRQALEYMVKGLEPVSEKAEKERAKEDVLTEEYRTAREQLRTMLENNYIPLKGIKGNIKIFDTFPQTISSEDFYKSSLFFLQMDAVRSTGMVDLAYQSQDLSYNKLTNQNFIMVDSETDNHNLYSDVYKDCNINGKLFRADYPKQELISTKAMFWCLEKDKDGKSRYIKQEEIVEREDVDTEFIKNSDIDWIRSIVADNIDNPLFERFEPFNTRGYAFIVMDFNDLKKAIKKYDMVSRQTFKIDKKAFFGDLMDELLKNNVNHCYYPDAMRAFYNKCGVEKTSKGNSESSLRDAMKIVGEDFYCEVPDKQRATRTPQNLSKYSANIEVKYI
ncbi:MAG: hypothetical protein IJ184_02950 [Alphaproteobacteria bacterium]|nr:hypothetical protein [Alphaproteobacteria bacterium]